VFLDFPDFAAKCLQLLNEAVPQLTAIGILWDPSTGSLQLAAVRAAARVMGINVHVFEARRAIAIADAFDAARLSRIDGLLVLSSPLFGGNPQLVADLAVRRNSALGQVIGGPIQEAASGPALGAQPSGCGFCACDVETAFAGCA
jgi:hypothetical protein